jgi:hypothetical protein
MAHVSIDVSNPADIRRQLPGVRALRSEKLDKIGQLAKEVEALGNLIESLETIAGPKNGRSPKAQRGSVNEVPARGRAPARQTAIEALRRAGRPMGPAALYRFMEEEGIPVPANPNALGATLWTAAKAGEIVKADRRYSMRPLTDYARAGEMGFPTPAKLPEPVEGNPGR